jgi:hypothetical protein
MEKIRLFPTPNKTMHDASIYMEHTESIDLCDCGYDSAGKLCSLLVIINQKDGARLLATITDDEHDDLWPEIVDYSLWEPAREETND